MVVGVDFSELSERAIASAVTFAHAATEADIHLVHAVPLPIVASELAVAPDLEAVIAAARERIARLVPQESPGVRFVTHVTAGVPQDVVDGIARSCGADLILVGTHGRRGFKRALLGSVAEHITRNAPCSVLTVRPRERTAEEQIEPPCADCEKAAAGSAGKEHSRCARHSSHRGRAHTYSSEPPENVGLGSMSFRF